MATLADLNFPNLQDYLSRAAPDGSIRRMIEVLSKKLDFLDDVPWVECNLDLGHEVSYRTGLPSPMWRSLNQGVKRTKTSAAQFIETTGQVADRAEVDVDYRGDIASFRLSEEKGKIEAMTQEFARALFYESTLDNADRIHGLSPRYGGTAGYTSSSYVKVGTNGGANARSIWLINWGPESVFGIYPKGSSAGLQRKDLGEIDCFDANSDKFRGFATELKWNCGIAVADYRSNIRFQWDPDDAAMADNQKGITAGMQDMLGMVFDLSPNARFYMDRISFRKFTAQLNNQTVNFLEYIAMGGKRVPHFLGVPIRITDALVAETAIS